jgi:hypothetical protein
MHGEIELRPRLEQVYFSRAIAASAEAKEHASKALESHAEFSWNQTMERAYDLGDEIDPEEDLTAAASAAAHVLGHDFGLCIQSIVLAHVFSALTLETHINAAAAAHLSGRARDEFDDLSIKGKWLFLPRLLNKESFDPGAEPYQSFSTLVAIRNRLVHAKSHDAAKVRGASRSPRELLSTGVREASRSVGTVRKMVLALATFLGVEPPAWLKISESTPYLLVYGS